MPDSQLARARSYLTELWRRREFAWFLAMGNLRAANVRTALGALWWVLNPLLLAGIYFLVFGVIFAGNRRGNPEYLAYLLSGMFPFHFTSRSLNGGAQSIIGNAKLIANLKFPRLLLPISGLIEALVGFLVSILVFYLLIVPTAQVWPGMHTLWLLLIIPLNIVLALGLSGMAARLAVPFRDLLNLIPYFTRLWLYLSPIIWLPEMIESAPDWVHTIIRLNPMYSLLALYRRALTGDPIQEIDVLFAIGWCLAIGAIGVYSFVRHEAHMARYL